MKKIFATTLLSTLLLTAAAQPGLAKINFDSISAIATSRNGAYDQLLKRFIKGDTTLDRRQCAIVYYGYSFRKGYSSEIPDEALTKAMDDNDPKAVEKQAGIILKKNPVNLKAIMSMAIAQEFLENERGYWDNMLKYAQIIEVISLSGDGKTPQTAYKVISASDQRNVLSGFTVKQREFLPEYQAEKVTAEKNGAEQVIYFDMSRSVAGAHKTGK